MLGSKKILRFIIAASILVVIGAVFLIARPSEQEKAQQIMKNQMSEAAMFVNGHGNELGVLQELKGRLNSIGYTIQKEGEGDATLHVSTYSSYAVKKGPKQSLADYPDISAEEKDTIYSILEALPVVNKTINITPTGISFTSYTTFGFNLFYVNTVTLNITDIRNELSDSSDSENFYYEQINDKWFISARFWQND